jgi:capsid assembly protease
MRNRFQSYRRQPWAVVPEVLTEIGDVLAGNATFNPDLEAQVAQAAVSASEDAASGSIAVLPLHGLITPRASLLSLLFGGGGGLEQFQRTLRAAVAHPDIEKIVLDVDSPGGSVSLVPETAAAVREAREAKPVVAVANTRAASAAYWIASQASELVVSPSGDVGSVGVLTFHDDVSKAQNMAGIKTTIVSAGKYKDEGNPYEPLGREAKAELQRYVDDVYAMFVDDVAAGRGANAQAVRNGFGQGRLVLAEEAVGQGMADRVETLEDTLTRLGAAPQETVPEPDEEAEASLDAKADQDRAAAAALLLPSE